MPPTMIDTAFRKDTRLAGEEVDPCGRWEPDTHCYKELLRKGDAAVPTHWKHKLCHTSSQAISHCMKELMDYTSFSHVNSGLLQRLCACCGLRLQLPVLHTLVVVTYYLAAFGLDGEDLLGAIWLLLTVLRAEFQFDPRQKVQVSIVELLGLDGEVGCNHTSLTPGGLARLLSEQGGQILPKKAELGWKVFQLVLKDTTAAWEARGQLYKEREEKGELIVVKTASDFAKPKYKCCFSYCGEIGTHGIFRQSRTFGHVFVVFQAEILTYRRQQEEDSWTSSNFDMQAVLEYLSGGDELQMPLMTGNMIKDHCCCGRYDELLFERKEDVEAFHFSNLDDWRRTSIIDDREWRNDEEW